MEEHRPLPPDLIAHRRFLERLALYLTGERDAADDLAQQAWLAAIEQPPRHGINLPAWLERVARNLHYRRRERERLSKTTELDPALPASETGPEESLASAETLQHVNEAVRALDEPHRTVVLLRFYEEKTPTQIAAELGRSVNTITSQLTRGLERLRAELDRRHEGDRERWVRALLPLVPRTWRREPGSTLRTGAGTTSLRGIALPTGVLLVTGIVVVRLSTLVPQSWSAPADQAGEVRIAAAAPASPPPSEVPAPPVQREPIVVGTESNPPSQPTTTEPTREASWLEFEVVDPQGAPIPGVRIDVTQPSAPLGPEDLVSLEGKIEPTPWIERGRTDARGRARIDLSAENVVNGDVGLVVRKPGFVRSLAHYVRYPPPDRGPIHVVLESPALAVRGRVLDVEGLPARALVSIGPEQGPIVESDGIQRVRQPMFVLTDPSGNFEYESLARILQRVVIRADGFLPLVDSVDGSSARIIERVFSLDRGATLFGTVTLDGNPVAGAEIHAEYSPPRIRTITQRTKSAADGTYRLPGIATGMVVAFARHPEDSLLVDAAILKVDRPEEQQWLPVLDRRPALLLRIVTDDEQPVSRAFARIASIHRGNWARTVTADDEGLAAINGLPVARYLVDVFRSEEDLSVGNPPFVFDRPVAVREEENRIVVPRERLEPAGLTGRVVPVPNQALTGPQIILRPLEGLMAYSTSVDASTGTFLNDRICPQSYEGFLFAENLGVMPLDVIEVTAGETLDLGEIVVPATGAVEVDWRWPGDESEYSFLLEQLAENRGWTEPQRWPVRSGQGRPSGAIQAFPGRFEWSVWKQGKELERQKFDVQSNAIVRLSMGPRGDDSER